jgi:hypothetical protein
VVLTHLTDTCISFNLNIDLRLSQPNDLKLLEDGSVVIVVLYGIKAEEI